MRCDAPGAFSRTTKVILVVGRMLRRKGHHVVVEAVRRLKEMGLKDFMCVFVGEDQGKSRYTGELWDLVLATGTDRRHPHGRADRRPAGRATRRRRVVVNAAIQPEGLQRAILEARGDGAAGHRVRPGRRAGRGAGAAGGHRGPHDRACASPPATSVALAAAVVRLFSLPPSGPGRDRARAGAPGCWRISTPRPRAEPTLRAL